jgi:hypothetical protein
MSVWTVAAFVVFLQQTPKASIEGYVVRTGTNDPIAGAEITVRRLGAAEPATAAPDDLTEIGRKVPEVSFWEVESPLKLARLGIPESVTFSRAPITRFQHFA